jgi:hypothetical protein
LPSDGELPEAKSASFRLPAGDWQEVTVPIPAGGPLGITRLYLPAQWQPVEIDWIEVNGKGAPKRWEF